MKKKKMLTVKTAIKKINTIIYVDDDVKTAINSLRKKNINHKIIYFYVVNEKNKLVGIVPTRCLLLAESNEKIKNIMKKVITINSDMPLDKAYKFFSKHKLLALPIVDDEGKFLGIIDIEEYIEKLTLLTDEKYCLDVFQIMGISIDKKVKSPFKNYIARMPWILCNMVGGIICAIISRMHEIVISKILILALFIPLVLALSESISMQAMTYSLQQIKNSTHQYLKSNILKESKTIMLMALTSGILVGIISIFWNYGVSASACISISIIISIFISALFGMAFPIILHRLNLDPKVAAGPVVLAFADVLTTSIYLGLASILFL